MYLKANFSNQERETKKALTENKYLLLCKLCDKILLDPKPDMIESYNLESQIEYLSFGLMTEINHFVLGTYITTQIEDTMNLNKQTSQMNIILGALLY